VERAHHTLQGRLVKELRLAGISTIEAANAFLPAFVQTCKARFAKPPARDRDLHRPMAGGNDLDNILLARTALCLATAGGQLQPHEVHAAAR
jgi:hypothetical protein